MAKTYNHLWPQIIAFETLVEAWARTSKGRHRQRDVIAFEADLEPNLFAIQESLIQKTYRTGPYHRFFVYEPKKREIASLPLKDRVVQHALVSVIEPIFEARFIDQSFACRVGKGAHKGADTVQRYMREVLREHGQVFALKADISKYFPSVCHDALRRIIRRRIACPDTLWLIDSILESSAEPGALTPRGIPIGNLTSQMFANIYLHELDHFVKHTMRERRYVRYMDDFAVIHHDKAHLHEVRQACEDFLWAELGLRTNAKTQVFPIGDPGRALDFLGYRIWPTHRALRKDSVNRMKRKMRRMAARYHRGEITWDDIDPVIMSWIGHARHADTYNLRTKVLGGVAFVPPPLHVAAERRANSGPLRPL
ncbi:Retron-type reverse transcriptase [[Luteovulum] sphaeroides subsp. megalophilum]|uniref:RNA-directed DNA polymerase n=1 Tax=Cereibacter sphaeroides TaxID=1063 RepID=UPI000B7056FF|nr:RNA-directed DNA polymerase [Cereibacter sphaeroides]SNS86371.1 Retron-type reverse transcriptase [[Luteovulum] sphaeroides subsp. megalophilum]